MERHVFHVACEMRRIRIITLRAIDFGLAERAWALSLSHLQHLSFMPRCKVFRPFCT